MVSDCTGLIAEFTDLPIYLSISEGTNAFTLVVTPCTVNNSFNIRCGKERFGATAAQAKEHILLALNMVRVSTYTTPHAVQLKVPFLPTMSFPVSDTEKVMDLVKKGLDTYF